LNILGVTGSAGSPGAGTDAERERLKERARAELDRSRNVYVLVGAGTALPNLFPRTAQASDPNAGRPIFELASALMARARELAPRDTELQGPMPMIHEFQEFQHREGGPGMGSTREPRVASAGPAGPVPPAIRVGGNVQAAKLVEKPEAPYPPLARQARIQGRVRFNIVIGQDGRVENATLTSGHPLLVPSATEAVRGYRYQPTLLNGTPVQVITQVDVLFMFER
jgi:TonB family protein